MENFSARSGILEIASCDIDKVKTKVFAVGVDCRQVIFEWNAGSDGIAGAQDMTAVTPASLQAVDGMLADDFGGAKTQLDPAVEVSKERDPVAVSSLQSRQVHPGM
jgi:hypothetical protein